MAIFEKWLLDFAVIGVLTDTGRIVSEAPGPGGSFDIPLDPLAGEAPLYHRPTTPTSPRPPLGEVFDTVGLEERRRLLRLIGCPDLASRRWVWDQYDSTIGGQTVRRPGAADAAVVKLEGFSRALALTTDCTPRYCAADPEAGGMQAVAEAWRNLTAVGARPLAITDNMNFGNPERPEIMGQFAAAVRGMAAACIALDFPVVSGNVPPMQRNRGPRHPADAGDRRPRGAGRRQPHRGDRAGAGAGPGAGRQDGRLARPVAVARREIEGREDGPPPPVDLAAERRNGDCVRGQIHEGRVRACHDVSDGGVLVAVAEMALAGGVGARLLAEPAGVEEHAFWFGEDQARYVLAVADSAGLLQSAAFAGVPAVRIGQSGDEEHLTLSDGDTISLDMLRATHEQFFPAWMDGPAA